MNPYETPSGELCPDLRSSAQERHGPVRASPEKNYQRAGASPPVVFAAGWKPSKSSGKIHPQGVAQTSRQFFCVLKSPKLRSVLPVTPAAMQGGGRALSAASPISPADAGML